MKLCFTWNFEYINFNRNKITVICRLFSRLVPTKNLMTSIILIIKTILKLMGSQNNSLGDFRDLIPDENDTDTSLK